MRRHWPPILMYHSVSRLARDPNMLCTSPERFEDQMFYLRRRGLRGVCVGELLREIEGGQAEGLVGLTFDDGYVDFLTTAVPVLEDFGFGATVFAVAGMAENDWAHAYPPRPRMELLTAEGLRAVGERGMEVGAHSVTHPRLSGLEPERLERQVRDGRRLLSETLGGEIEGFCYPYGDLDEAALRSVRRAGYSYACAWNRRVEGGVYDLPRIPVSNRDTRLRFAAKLKAYPQYSTAKKVLASLR